MNDSEKTLIVPQPLKKGDRIAILSPAGIIKPEFVYQAMQVLQDEGYEPFVMPHALGRWRTYSGTAADRLSDLRQAILDPSVKAILCSRGGYGAVHLLEELDRLPLRDNPKWIIGYSDISALHALMHRHGIVSVHAPMAKHLAMLKGRDDDARALFGILSGEPQLYSIPPSPLNRPGTAVAPLVGGNLAVIADLVATPFDTILPDTILFIEDIAEPIYKTERILYQLRLSGALSRLKGLIVGACTDYTPDVDGHTMEEMVSSMVSDYTYPVAFGVPVGHVDHNIPLQVSLPTRLEVTPEQTYIVQPADA